MYFAMATRLVRLSIRQQVLLLIGAIVMPMAALLAWFHLEDTRRAREDALAEVAIVSSNAAANLSQFLAQTEAVLARLAARARVRSLDPKNCDPIVAEYVNLNPEFAQLGNRDLDGNIICSYRSNPIPRINAQECPWFGEGLRAGSFYASNLSRGRQVGRWVSVFTHPIRGGSGEVIGLRILPVDLLKLGTRLLGSVPPSAIVSVVDQTGGRILRSSEAEKYLGAPRRQPLQHLFVGGARAPSRSRASMVSAGYSPMSLAGSGLAHKRRHARN